MMPKSLMRVALVTGGILLVPVLGGWPWGMGDFVIMGILLFGTGMVMEYVINKVKDTNQRALIVLAVLGVFFVIWAQLAVGLLTKMVWGLECLANRGLSQTIQCANDVRRTEY